MSSFLNSVLSSIGGKEPSKDLGQTVKPTTSSTTTRDVSIKVTRPASAALNPPLKRKAEAPSAPPPSKISRPETPNARPLSSALPTHPKSNPVNTITTATGPVVRPGLTTQASSTNVKAVGPPVKAPVVQAQSSFSATGAKPGPKGSYREILARAEAAQAAQADFGQIKHKPVLKDPKLSRKERLAQKTDAAQKTKQGIRAGKVDRRDTGARGGGRPNNRDAESSKEKKKPLDLGYKGTMRQAPTSSTYKGTMNTQASTSARSAGRVPPTSAPKRPPDGATANRYKYASYSDEEDEEEEDYDDESDMEAAGFDELEEEEQMSLRVAKKEDEEALREENEHKRLKAEKRKKLEQLAAARRK